MTTLPPEGQGEPGTEGVPTSDPTGAPSAPTTPPAAPEPPQGPPAPQSQPQYAPPQQPPASQQPPAPQQPPQYAPPPTGGYPQQPGGYPGASNPNGGYQGPPPGGYQQQGYAQPIADPATNVTLNYWLSVFFTWIPALIFYLVDRDKGDQRLYVFQRENLNFSLLRVGVVVVAWILGMIPYIGWLLAFLLWLGSIVLFVFHIIAAVKSTESFRRGEQPGFIVNIPLVK